MNAASTIQHIIVKGRVQGVGFRYFIEREALRRGVQGWVRNRRDNSVEALFAGSPQSVDAMIVACRLGPPSSQVDALDQRDGSEAELALRHAGELFSVLPTP